MNAETRRPLLLAIAAASVLSVGGLAWLARGLLVPPNQAGSTTLLELLNDSRRQGAEVEKSRPRAPAPPANVAWASPLRQSCPVRDTVLKQRLTKLSYDLDQRSRPIKIQPYN